MSCDLFEGPRKRSYEPMRPRKIVFSVLVLLISTFAHPVTAYASISGCPSTWNLKVDLRPGNSLTAIRGEDPEVTVYTSSYFESSGQLDSAIKQYGKNIAYKYFAEWSQDGVKWYDIFQKTTDSRGYFTNSFEAQTNLFVHFDQLFRYFQGGKWRTTLQVEIADCPKDIGLFYSTPIALKYSIADDKIYSLKEFLSKESSLNFKDIEAQIKELEDWKSKTTADLNSIGVSRSVPDLPGVSNLVVASGGTPPCMNYVNRNWKATDTDCILEIFYVRRVNPSVAEYFLVDKVEITYASSLKAKSAVEAKAKQDAEAKAKQEVDAKAKAEAEAQNKLAAETEARAAAIARQAQKSKYILCVKGKVVKKVMGTSAKCPSGYKKK